MNIQDIKIFAVESEALEKLMAIELPENEKLSVDRFALFENKFGIDPDCCFWPLELAHLDNKIQTVVEIACRIKKYDDKGTYSIRMDKPDFIKLIPIADLLAIATTMNLVDFIRFNYNPRISSNQNLLMKHIRESYTVSEV